MIDHASASLCNFINSSIHLLEPIFTSISDLVNMGVKCVRIGAVGIGENKYFELSGFLTEPLKLLDLLEQAIELLENSGINVIITLKRTLASAEICKLSTKNLHYFLMLSDTIC